MCRPQLPALSSGPFAAPQLQGVDTLSPAASYVTGDLELIFWTEDAVLDGDSMLSVEVNDGQPDNGPTILTPDHIDFLLEVLDPSYNGSVAFQDVDGTWCQIDVMREPGIPPLTVRWYQEFTLIETLSTRIRLTEDQLDRLEVALTDFQETLMVRMWMEEPLSLVFQGFGRLQTRVPSANALLDLQLLCRAMGSTPAQVAAWVSEGMTAPDEDNSILRMSEDLFSMLPLLRHIPDV